MIEYEMVLYAIMTAVGYTGVLWFTDRIMCYGQEA